MFIIMKDSVTIKRLRIKSGGRNKLVIIIETNMSNLEECVV